MTATVPILTFHNIDDGSSPLCFPMPRFERAMKRLSEEGYRTIRLVELAELLQKGLPLPSRSVVITFDDGDQSVYTHAWPVLRGLGMTATVFILPSDAPRQFLGRPLMTWEQIDEMHRGAIDFGAHTIGHCDLTRLSVEQVDAEIVDSKSLIESRLKEPVSCFAYPFGRFDARSREIASRHFGCACSDALGLVHAQTDPYALKRVDMYYLRSGTRFDLLFKPYFPWYLHARNLPRRIRRLIVPPPRVDAS